MGEPGAGRARLGKRLSPDWGRIFARLSLEAPGIDWYDTPLDRVQFAIEELTGQEERATWRAYTSFREVKLEDAMRLGTPDWADKSEEGGRSNAAPYPVTPSVARGLDQAVALGLLVSESWSEWPVGREAMPLRLLWERIAARL